MNSTIEEFLQAQAKGVRGTTDPSAEFVRKVLKQHAHLITLWGGPWKHVTTSRTAPNIAALDKWRTNSYHALQVALDKLEKVYDLRYLLPMWCVWETLGQGRFYHHPSCDGVACKGADHHHTPWPGTKPYPYHRDAEKFPPAPPLEPLHEFTFRCGQSVSKVVLAWALRLAKKDARLKPYCLAWSKILGEVGQLWATARPVHLTFTCAPTEFLHLGRDFDTCLSDGEGVGTQEVLAFARNTFVVWGYTNPGTAFGAWSPRAGVELKARGFGSIAPGRGAEATNFYGFDPVIWEAVLEETLPGVIGVPERSVRKLGVSKAGFMRDTRGIYRNGDSKQYVLEGVEDDVARMYLRRNWGEREMSPNERRYDE